MEKNVTVILIARTTSTRCPGKVIKPFAQEMSLFEMMCQKLKKLEFPFAAGVGEEELVEIAKRNDVAIFQRTPEEVKAHTPLSKIFKCVSQCQTSHAMLISPCTPFLEAQTLNHACRNFCQSKEWNSMSSVTKEQNWFFDENRKPLVSINTHHMDSKQLCIYALANSFEVFPVDRFLKEGIYYTFSNPQDPFLYEIPKGEAFDIDTTEDFELGKSMWEFRLRDKSHKI